MKINFKFLLAYVLIVILILYAYQMCNISKSEMKANSHNNIKFENEIKSQINKAFDKRIKEIVHTDIKESGLLIFYTSYDTDYLSYVYVENNYGDWKIIHGGQIELNKYSYILTVDTGMPFYIALISASPNVDKVTILPNVDKGTGSELPLKHVISGDVSFWYRYTERLESGATVEFYSNGEKIRY